MGERVIVSSVPVMELSWKHVRDIAMETDSGVDVGKRV